MNLKKIVPTILTASGVTAPTYQDSDITDISGLILWFRATSLLLSNNDPIGLWEDESASGNNAQQAVEANKPIYIADGIGGKPAIQFIGDGSAETSGFLDLDSGLPAGTFTLLIVMANTSDLWTFIAPNSSYAYSDRIIDSSGYKWQSNDGVYTPTSDTLSVANAIGKLLCQTNDNVDIDHGVKFYENGVAKGDGGRFNWINYFRQRIGQDLGKTAVNNGHIAEIIMYDSVLSEADRQAVEAHLNKKYVLGF